MRARSLGWLMLSIFGCGIAAGSAAEPPPRYPYRMLISDMLTEKILMLEKDGSASWELSQPGWVMDGERLPNGNYLVAQTFEQAVVEYAPDGTVVRRFPHPGMTYGASSACPAATRSSSIFWATAKTAKASRYWRSRRKSRSCGHIGNRASCCSCSCCGKGPPRFNAGSRFGRAPPADPHDWRRADGRGGLWCIDWRRGSTWRSTS